MRLHVAKQRRQRAERQRNHAGIRPIRQFRRGDHRIRAQQRRQQQKRRPPVSHRHVKRPPHSMDNRHGQQFRARIHARIKRNAEHPLHDLPRHRIVSIGGCARKIPRRKNHHRRARRLRRQTEPRGNRRSFPAVCAVRQQQERNRQHAAGRVLIRPAAQKAERNADHAERRTFFFQQPRDDQQRQKRQRRAPQIVARAVQPQKDRAEERNQREQRRVDDQQNRPAKPSALRLSQRIQFKHEQHIRRRIGDVENALSPIKEELRQRVNHAAPAPETVMRRLRGEHVRHPGKRLARAPTEGIIIIVHLQRRMHVQQEHGRRHQHENRRKDAGAKRRLFFHSGQKIPYAVHAFPPSGSTASTTLSWLVTATSRPISAASKGMAGSIKKRRSPSGAISS